MLSSNNSLSVSEARKVENILIGYYLELSQQLKEIGQWHIPHNIQDEIKNLGLSKLEANTLDRISGGTTPVEEGKAIFNGSKLLAEKFCLLKIKEIKQILIEGSAEKPKSNVSLFVLEHKEESETAFVTTAHVRFKKDGIAETVSYRNSTQREVFPNTFLALKRSKWLTTCPEETIIRFADRKIENSLSIKLYCDEIEYALPSDKVKESANKGKNFWETYAISYKTTGLDHDLSMIDVVKKKMKKHIVNTSEIKLEKHLGKIGRPNSELDQTQYVTRILRNQRLGMGSLLYLPTGFGKTFIMLLAMAQHYISLPVKKRKPYLIVGPKNVKDSWDHNLKIAEEQFEGNQKVFGEKLSILKPSTEKELSDYIKKFQNNTNAENDYQNSDQIVIITEELLKNHVSAIYKGQGKLPALIENHLSLLKRSGIITGSNLIIGSKVEEWKKQILGVFSQLCTPRSVFTLLTNNFAKELQGEIKEYSNKEEDNWKTFFNNIENIALFRNWIGKKSETLLNTLALCRIDKAPSPEESADLIFNHLRGYFISNESIKKRLTFNRDLDPDKAFEKCIGNDNKPESLLHKLKEMSDAQLLAQKKFADFINCFNGILVDESHSVFAKNPGRTVNTRDIIFEMSDVFLTSSKKHSPENPLIIAASATPWPNDLDQLKLHLQFLVPVQMKEYIKLNDFLFNKWNKLEKRIEEYAKQRTIENRLLTEIQRSAAEVQEYFYPWVNNFFNELVIYEKPSQDQINVNDKFFYILCKDENKVAIIKEQKKIQEVEEKANNMNDDSIEEVENHESKEVDPESPSSENESGILRIISKFYSGLLGNGELPNNKKQHYNTICEYVNKLNGVYSDTIQKCLNIIKAEPHKKIAIYVDETKDALFLEKILSDYYDNVLAISRCEIGLYYNDIFVSNQGRDANTPTLNKNRDANKNAFNNEFHFPDYINFISERFTSTRLNATFPVKEISRRLKPLYLMFKAIIEGDNSRRLALLEEAEDQTIDEKQKAANKSNFKVFDSLFRYMRELLCDNHHNVAEVLQKAKTSIQEDKDLSKDQISQCRTFIDFMVLTVEFERASKSTIIYFDKARDGKDWLNLFQQFLPNKKGTVQTVKDAFESFRASIDSDVQEKHTVSTSLLLSIQYTLIYYIHKIFMSRIFIFGQAGTSGMRIDADTMFMFSGAWTEGKLTQIRGRFGRRKVNSIGRRCDIYAPLTNSCFEFFILKYYIIKSLYDTFVTSAKLNLTQLCEPILLSQLLYQYYNTTLEKFVIDDVVNKVKDLQSTNPTRSYFDYTAIEKAKFIATDNINKSLKVFITSLEAMPPINDINYLESSFDLPLSQDEDIDLILTNESAQSVQCVLESWPPLYSREIESYAMSSGETKSIPPGMEGCSAEILSALIGSDKTFSTTMTWEPTNREIEREELSIANPEISTITKALHQHEAKHNQIIQIRTDKKQEHLEINQAVFEANLQERRHCFEHKLEGGKVIRINYEIQVKKIVITNVPENFDEFYLELVTKPGERHVIKSIAVKTLKLLDHEYRLTGYLCGGCEEGYSHYWTVRQGVDGYYHCDDLKQITYTSGPMPTIDPRAILFKFVRSDLYADIIRLKPKNLTNYDNNCYINSAYQLAETSLLREKIASFTTAKIQNHMALPTKNPSLQKSQSSNKKSDSSYKIFTNSNPQEPPKIQADVAADWTENDWKRLDAFVKPGKNHIIIIAPSRGEAPDLTLSQFSQHLISSCDDNTQIILLFGTNSSNSDKLTTLIVNNTKVTSALSDSPKIFIKDIPFLWFENDRKSIKRIPPIGQMRNFCLGKAREAWTHMLQNPLIGKQSMSIFSADGDTEITQRCITRSHHLFQNSKYKHALLVYGYEIYFNNAIVSQTANAEDQKSDTFITALANHISMNINSKLVYSTRNADHYVGYPSEPLLVLSPATTECLLADIHSSPGHQVHFGYWDIEGRHLANSLQQLYLGTQTPGFAIIAPESDPNIRPILREYKRFMLKAPIYPYLKLRLEKEKLSELIRSFYKQSQSSINVRFLSRNLANFLSQNRIENILHYPSYFYFNNILRYLNLGPERAMQLAKWLRNKYVIEVENVLNDNDLEKYFGITALAFNQFVNATFDILFKRNVANSKKLFDLVTRWLLEVTNQLSIWFHPEFSGERDQQSRFYAMNIPLNYPNLSTSAVKDEEQTNLAETIRDLLIERNCIEYPTNSPMFASNFKKNAELKHLISDDDEKIFVIAIYASYEDYQSKHLTLIVNVNSVRPKKTCFGVHILEDEERLEVIATRVDQDKNSITIEKVLFEDIVNSDELKKMVDSLIKLNPAEFKNKRKHPDPIHIPSPLPSPTSSTTPSSSAKNSPQSIKIALSPSFSETTKKMRIESEKNNTSSTTKIHLPNYKNLTESNRIAILNYAKYALPLMQSNKTTNSKLDLAKLFTGVLLLKNESDDNSKRMAFDICHLLVEKYKFTDATYLLALFYYNGKNTAIDTSAENDKLAFQWLLKAENLNYADMIKGHILYLLGNCYLNNKGVTTNDKAKNISTASNLFKDAILYNNTLKIPPMPVKPSTHLTVPVNNAALSSNVSPSSTARSLSPSFFTSIPKKRQGDPISPQQNSPMEEKNGAKREKSMK